MERVTIPSGLTDLLSPSRLCPDCFAEYSRWVREREGMALGDIQFSLPRRMRMDLEHGNRDYQGQHRRAEGDHQPQTAGQVRLEQQAACRPAKKYKSQQYQEPRAQADKRAQADGTPRMIQPATAPEISPSRGMITKANDEGK